MGGSFPNELKAELLDQVKTLFVPMAYFMNFYHWTIRCWIIGINIH